MIKQFFQWFLSPSRKEMICEEPDIYSKIIELENRIARLEEENIETSNCLYELSNHIDAVDARIDIVSTENLTKNV